MEEVVWQVVWCAVFVTVAVIGGLMIARRRSWLWRAAGIAYVLGALGYLVWYFVEPDPPVPSTARDIAGWSLVLGGLSIFVAMVLTLVALGRKGRRQFLVLFAAVTVAVVTYQYWTANWPARFGDVRSYCTDQGFDFRGGPVQRTPPGVTCYDHGREVFVPADGLSWVALGGWSLFYGFIATFPAMGIAWLISNRQQLAPVGAG